MKASDRKFSGHFANRPDNIKSWRRTDTDPATLLEFIRSKTGEERHSRLKSWLTHDQLAVDGVVTSKFDYPLPSGASVELNLSRGFVRFKHPRMKLIYEDADILVVEKGYGLLSVATDPGKHETTAYSIMRDYVKSVNPRNKLFIVHRLDKDTSGLMMFAKNIAAKEAMQHNWDNMVLDRRYVAVVEKGPAKQSGIIKSYLGETSQHEVYSSTDPRDGKEAITRFRVLRRGPRFSLVEYTLDTGRKNQIRVHSKVMGCPISGDRRYGASPSPIKRLALHAETLEFVHPSTRKLMKFVSPPPSSFRRLTGYTEENTPLD